MGIVTWVSPSSFALLKSAEPIGRSIALYFSLGKNITNEAYLCLIILQYNDNVRKWAQDSLIKVHTHEVPLNQIHKPITGMGLGGW